MKKKENEEIVFWLPVVSSGDNVDINCDQVSSMDMDKYRFAKKKEIEFPDEIQAQVEKLESMVKDNEELPKLLQKNFRLKNVQVKNVKCPILFSIESNPLICKLIRVGGTTVLKCKRI